VHEHAFVTSSLTAAQILSCWEADGRRFSSEAVSPLLHANFVSLYHCCHCGFEFFKAGLEGSSLFYEELARDNNDYYSPSRPENKRNAEFAARHGYESFLDIGCGTGYALDCAREFRLKTYGLELNPVAGAEASDRGHEVFIEPLACFAERSSERFDMITLNQCLEHVPDPVSMLESCKRLLTPRGTIGVAVPNARGVLALTPWLAANWPPHHMSRWRVSDLHMLGQRLGMKTVHIGGARLTGEELVRIIRGHEIYCKAIHKNYRGPTSRNLQVIKAIYTVLMVKYLPLRFGHSIHAYYRHASF